MASRPTPAHPVQTLREHVTALEAAITLALADPKKEPVHRLRTSTRRIEAQLELLTLLPSLPDHAKPAKKARKLLKKLRRAAGSVRDLDVQRDLLKQHATSAKLRKDAASLRRTLKHQRSAEAASLTKLLKAEQRKLAPALEHLLDALKPAQDLSLSPTELSGLTLNWYRHNTPAARPDSDPDHLHTIRKSAKLARYIAESGAGELAATFESLQQAGGAWHDFLTLTEITSQHLGRKSPLAETFTRQCNTALNHYKEALRHQPNPADPTA